MKTADGSIVPWVASQSDLLADDWYGLDPWGEVEPDSSSDEAE